MAQGRQEDCAQSGRFESQGQEEKTKKKPSNSAPVVGPDGPTLADVLPRLLGVAIFSLTGALALPYIAYALVQALPSVDIVLGKTMSQEIIISVFLAGFIFIFIPLLKRYVPTIQSSRRGAA